MVLQDTDRLHINLMGVWNLDIYLKNPFYFSSVLEFKYKKVEFKQNKFK